MAKNQCKPLPRITDGQILRFWKHVAINGADECWPWMAGRLPSGYGHFFMNGGTFKSHRLAYFLSTGIDPMEKLVCHHCDNPPCCNPAHLFTGTHGDNARDRSQKGRSAFGDKNWTRTNPEKVRRGDRHILRMRPELAARGENVKNSKITSVIAVGIRDKYAIGQHSLREVADIFGVSKSLAHDVIKRKTWKHV